jgi:SAM-dependent methyltransferase
MASPSAVVDSRPPSTAELWTSPERTESLRRDADRYAAASRENETLLLAEAKIEPGLAVLDLACGGGDPTLAIGARVGPSGRVVGVDISEGALGVARERAERAGLTQVRFETANAEQLPFPDASFDRVVSRFGAMFWEDLAKAAREMRRVLRPEGRVALMVWASFDRQPYFRTTVGTVLDRLGLSAPPPDKSVPFRFAEAGPLESALSRAGFSNVRSGTHTVNWVLDASPEEASEGWWSAVVFWRSLIDRIPEAERESARRETVERFRSFYDGRLLRVPETVRVVTAAR